MAQSQHTIKQYYLLLLSRAECQLDAFSSLGYPTGRPPVCRCASFTTGTAWDRVSHAAAMTTLSKAAAPADLTPGVLGGCVQATTMSSTATDNARLRRMAQRTETPDADLTARGLGSVEVACHEFLRKRGLIHKLTSRYRALPAKKGS